MKSQLITLLLIGSLASLTACQQSPEETPPSEEQAPENKEESGMSEEQPSEESGMSEEESTEE